MKEQLFILWSSTWFEDHLGSWRLLNVAATLSKGSCPNKLQSSVNSMNMKTELLLRGCSCHIISLALPWHAMCNTSCACTNAPVWQLPPLATSDSSSIT